MPIGYCISSDRYFKRDELGIIYQMNIAPVAQRKLVAASLLKAVFERAPDGCKLFCCWCAQDLAANAFWESMGFLPLAFRVGQSARENEAYFLWQKRDSREGDVTTPYWFPAKTGMGARWRGSPVLPDPAGRALSAMEMPMMLPQMQRVLPEPAKKDRSAKMPKPRVQTKQPLAGLSFTPVEILAEKITKPKREKDQSRSGPRRQGAGVAGSVSGAIQFWFGPARWEIPSVEANRKRSPPPRCSNRRLSAASQPIATRESL